MQNKIPTAPRIAALSPGEPEPIVTADLGTDGEGGYIYHATTDAQ